MKIPSQKSIQKWWIYVSILSKIIDNDINLSIVLNGLKNKKNVKKLAV